MPLSIASLVRVGRASTAKRRRSAGFRSRRRIHQGIPRGGAWGGRGGLARNGGCIELAEVPGCGVRGRGARVSGDRPGRGAAATWARGARGDVGALAGGSRGGRPGVHCGGGVQDVPAAGAGVGRRRLGGGRGAGAGAADGGVSAGRGGQRRAHGGAGAGGGEGGAAAGDADPARLSRQRAGDAVLRLRYAAPANAPGEGGLAGVAAGADGGVEARQARDERAAGGGGAGAESSDFTAGSAPSWRWWRRSRNSSIRGAGPRGCT